MVVQWLKVFHVLGIVLWLGSTFHVSRGLAKASRVPEGARPALYDLLRRSQLLVGLPGMILVLLAGVTMLLRTPLYLEQPWMHLKLGLAALMIGLEVWLFALVNKYRVAPGPSSLPMMIHGLAGLFFFGILIAVFVMR